jgi:hypothetical protein
VKRPDTPGSPPPGHHWEAVVESGDSWQIWRGGKCRFIEASKQCGKPPVAAFLRGTAQKLWWPYCEDHLYGRWVEDGLVMHWKLVEDDGGGA